VNEDYEKHPLYAEALTEAERRGYPNCGQNCEDYAFAEGAVWALSRSEHTGHLICFDEFFDGSTQWSCVCGFKSQDEDEVLRHADAWLIKSVPLIHRP
jgi:hypothetical protein